MQTRERKVPLSKGITGKICESVFFAACGEQFGHLSVGPLRYIAAKAGLGIVRKNNFFYTENGSFNTLVGYVIDKACELIQETNIVPCGEKCDLCQRACKTKALQAPNIPSLRKNAARSAANSK